MSITEEKIAENATKIEKLIETFSQPRREKVQNMFDGWVGEEYFTAPASSREEFHNCFAGGLCDHSLRVVAYLWRLQKDLCPDRWKKETLAFVGLFHDLGKIGVDGKPRYVPNENAYQRREWGKLYVVNPEMPWMSINDATCFALQQHGVEVSHEEYLALRLADGQYEADNSKYAMREPDLGLLLHWADMWASREEKSKVSGS